MAKHKERTEYLRRSFDNKPPNRLEPPSQRSDGTGLCISHRSSQYSKQTQDLLTLMMQESRVTNRQRKHINQCLKNGTALPLTFDPTPSASPPQPKTSAHKALTGKPQKRSAESCRSGNSYVREKFLPGPRRDLEEEKRRLQGVMATGEEEPKAAAQKAHREAGVVEQKDRYQEVLDEIEERREFLADMSSLGQEKQYINIINTEISQRIRELRMLEKKPSLKSDDESNM